MAAENYINMQDIYHTIARYKYNIYLSGGVLSELFQLRLACINDSTW